MPRSQIGSLYSSISRLGHRSYLVACVESFLILASLLTAFAVRFDFHLPAASLLWLAAPVLLAIRLPFLANFNLLRGWWRYTGMSEMLDIVRAIGLGSLVFFIAVRLILHLPVPLSVFLLEALLTIFLLISCRLFSRSLAAMTVGLDGPSKLLGLIGAGAGAEVLIHALQKPGSAYTPLICFDDNPSKRGIRIHGVKVEGGVDQLPAYLKKHRLDEVWIAVPSATKTEMNRFVAFCEHAKIAFKTLPSLPEMMHAGDPLSQIRPVNLDDLLGREPVNLSLDVIREQVEGRVIMVTGAAGSIGSELCMQILEYDPLQLVCLDQNENGIFFLELSLNRHRNGDRTTYKVADICNASRVEPILRECGVQVIFHAAAYKHVPVMERNPQEALSNNVFGLVNLLSLADNTGCESFVMISSDKAVNPTNVMGATKRIGELIVASRPSKMRCVSVRFGNVLGSNGSVVPILQQQIREAGEMTITHPEIKRFFMTIGEAVSLVLQAFTVGDHGDLLVLDMGHPIRIVDLARALVRLSGKEESEVPIRIIGLREGEKLHEELLYASEETFPTTCEKINRIKSKLLNWSELSLLLQELECAMPVETDLEVQARIQRIVPEYSGGQPRYLKARMHSA